MTERPDGGWPRYTLDERKRWAEACPWIKRLKKPVQCEGWTPRKHPCKNPAYWTYKFSKPRARWHDVMDPGKTLHFCWNHLSSRGVAGSMTESERFHKWSQDNGYPERLIKERESA